MGNNKKNLKNKWLPMAIIGMAGFAYSQNNWITTRRLTYTHSKIPVSFSGFKILQISDLHDKAFGKGQHYLLEKIKKEQPDIIVITGDLIDSRRKGKNNALVLTKQMLMIAPVYYVSGNHERSRRDFLTIKNRMEDQGVKVLEDQRTSLRKNGENIDLIGMMDPLFKGHILFKENLKILSKDSGRRKINSFKILLSHRPEWMDFYSKCGVNLVFSGHAHGGQFRLPFIGGVFVPKQGFFPKYTYGPYQNGDTTMIVSRGLGNSLFPLRLFNRPEIVVVELKRSAE